MATYHESMITTKFVLHYGSNKNCFITAHLSFHTTDCADVTGNLLSLLKVLLPGLLPPPWQRCVGKDFQVQVHHLKIRCGGRWEISSKERFTQNAGLFISVPKVDNCDYSFNNSLALITSLYQRMGRKDRKQAKNLPPQLCNTYSN